MPRLEYRLLGPLEVSRDGTRVQIGAARQRTLLAALLVHANEVVDTDQLIDYVWDARPPATARGTLQSLVLRLRQVLEPGRAGRRGDWRVIDARPPGYRIAASAQTLDVSRFAALTVHGREALAEGHADVAANVLREALELWRGPALADVGERLRSEIVPRLTEQRLSALEARVDADLALGRHAELVAELRTLVVAHPLHEHVHSQLMRALQRSGRRAEALDAYQALRQVLVAELGVEPAADLQQLHLELLGRDPAIPAASPKDAALPSDTAPPAVKAKPPAQLPADVPGFVGRVDQLVRLGKALARSRTTEPVPAPVIAITGVAGVGKTALAVHWAHRALGAFPHGQLYLDLRGCSTDPPLRPLEAVAQLLRALHVAPERVPTDLAEAAALYRSLLAGRQVLVVLDNAASGEQVRPLLPGDPGSLVIVTSRNRLSTLVARNGACLLPLGVLTAAESRQLIEQMLGRDRVAREPVAAADLARLCGYLPLALRTAAALLVDRPIRTIADHAADLNGRSSLDALDALDAHEALVRRTFDLSYQALEPRARRLFRLLGTVPGADVTPSAAAALLGVRAGDAAALLDDLAGAHLVEEHAVERFRCHDLVRMYAAGKAANDEPADERAAAFGRLMRWYLAGVDEAARRLYPQFERLPAKARPKPPPVGSPVEEAAPVPDHESALAWLDAERSNLAAATMYCAQHGPRRYAWWLADALRGYFDLRRDVIGFSAIARAGLDAARAAGDQLAMAAAYRAVAHVQVCTARFTDALASLAAALSCCRQAGWRSGEAATFALLGAVHIELGNLEQATGHLRAALALRRTAADPAMEGNCHDNLAEAYVQMGLLPQAANHYGKALEGYRRTGTDSGEAHALTGLAWVCQRLGNTADAECHLASALMLYRRVGNRVGVALALRGRAELYHQTRRLDEALDTARESLDIVTTTGDRTVEANILCTLGATEHAVGQHLAAGRSYRRALDLAQAVRAPYATVEALLGLGTLAGEMGSRAEAEHYLSRAASIADERGFRALKAQAVRQRQTAALPGK